jgi:hypothetical protein
MRQVIKSGRLANIHVPFLDALGRKFSWKMIDGLSISGSQYGAPRSYYQRDIYYRTDIFHKAGIRPVMVLTYPKSPPDAPSRKHSGRSAGGCADNSETTEGSP